MKKAKSPAAGEAADSMPRAVLGPAVVVALILAALLAWEATRLNLANHFAAGRSPEADRQALSWYAAEPDALLSEVLRRGAQGTTDDPMLLLAGRANPAEGRLFAILGLRAEAAQAPEYAEQAMQTATRLAPQRTDVRLAAYRFWLRRGNLVKALDDVNVVLTRERGLAAELFPELLRLLAHPQADAAFTALLDTRVTWWPEFFAFAARRGVSVEVLRTLYAMQRSGANEVSEAQLKVYIDRLIEDGRWLDAYPLWMSSVPPDQLSFSGELHNGGFEEPTRSFGFEWISQPAQGVMVGFDPTYGTGGTKALHVVFQGGKTRWRHFYQTLMLAPGDYTLRGRVRIDSLRTAEGVQWTLTCRKGAAVLGSSERFKGSDQWRHFQTGFSVPPDCPLQELRLGLVGKAALDFEAEGQIWFDDLLLQRQ